MKISAGFKGSRQSSQGVILIALLWILTALSAIALSFSKEGFVEVAAARNSQALEESYFTARAGIEATIYQMLQKQLVPRTQRLEFQGEPDQIDLGRVTGRFGNGIYQVDIQDESGKINLNSVSDVQLRALLEALAIDKRDVDIIADSIMDWRDQDTNHRMNGAEDDYYQSLNPPYKAKNGRLDTVEELLLIQGVTPEYFYGYPERAPDGSIIYKYGLQRCVTVYTTSSNVINVNSAPLPVLLSISGMPPDAAQMIIEKRQVKPFKTMNDLTSEIPALSGIPLQLSTNPTAISTLTASAHRENSKVQRVIRTVISLDPRDRKQYRILYWNENVQDYEGMPR
jgi:general secretion pathway protein K